MFWRMWRNQRAYQTTPISAQKEAEKSNKTRFDLLMRRRAATVPSIESVVNGVNLGEQLK